MNASFKIELFILRFRQTIPAGCATARSIDRNDSWRNVARIARIEGYVLFADGLERACQLAGWPATADTSQAA
jgi:hypothetical protein